MFEKEIKFIIDFTLNRINKLGSFFTFERLASAEVHPAIILYISAQLDYLIYEDRKKILQNSSFDYSGSEISKYFNMIGEEIKKNKRLAFEDVKTLVTHAVTFNINYLVRPNWTLSRLIFDEQKTRNVNEIRMMLNYLYYYDYVKNVFFGYFSRRKILSLSEVEFDMILGKIDRQMFNERTTDLIDNALVSIGDFFNEGGLNKTQVSPQTVEMFLKEKNLMEALFRLKRSIPSEDKQKYSIEEIRKILYAKEPVKVEKTEYKKEDISEKTDSEKFKVSEEESDSGVEYLREKIRKENLSKEAGHENKDEGILNEPEAAAEKAETSREKDKPKTGPLQQDEFLSRYETELKSLEELEAQLNNLGKEEDLSFNELDEEKVVEQPEEKVETKELNKDESMTFDEIMSDKQVIQDTASDYDQTPSEELIIEEEEFNPFDDDEGKKEKSVSSAKRKNDVLGSLTDKEMEKIVANVFNEDEEDFVNTMEKISESASYDSATEILKAVFFSYKINPYSKDAVTLTNAVSNFFNRGK